MAHDDLHAVRRNDILTESLEDSNRPRWGYFGLAGSLAIGDNSYAPNATRRPPPENPDGEPIRNIQTKPLIKGAGPDVYFQFETPLANGDPYQDPGILQKRGKVTMLDPEAPFRPPGKVKNYKHRAPFPYEDHKDTLKDPRDVYQLHKDVMPLRQIYTNPPKKGGGGVLTKGVLFGMDEERAFPEHAPDDYEAPRQRRLEELNQHRAKLPEMPFKGMDFGGKHFQDNSELYTYDVPTHVPREPKQEIFKTAEHESAFKPSNPSKKGLVHGSFSFPEYLEDPVPGGALRRPPPEGEQPPAFRLGNPRVNPKPTPSVVSMTRNMRSERPSSFARPTL